MTKKRLDELLVERGVARDRREARAVLLSGQVFVEGQRQSQAGLHVDVNTEIAIKKRHRRYVSRGGLKLEGALEDLKLDVADFCCLDLGASTGGFTDCLLQKGANRVYALDVGKGQLDWSLRQDSRIILLEGLNARYLNPALIQDKIDLITADLSFISVQKIFPVLDHFPEATYLLLIKPQFEARRWEVQPGGLIPQSTTQLTILRRIQEKAEGHGFTVLGSIPSRVKGQKGNQEYFLLMRRTSE